MRITDLHNWNMGPGEAVKLQSELAGRVRRTRLRKTPTLIGGVDCALTADASSVIACIVIMQLPSLNPLEIRSAIKPLRFPYVPGLLSFREAPACIAAARKLVNVPDVFIVDGQGTAHPRRFGIASHLGLFFDKPTIGCAKSRLIGQYAEP
ncbi:MAG TPA: endonuclease V, partial [Sedimentisphaerales bacterium]|nr:endonuclease V [Sedimentisphaerales bacterium]